MCIRTNQQPSTTQARLGKFCACATQSNKGKTRLNYSVKQQKLDHAPSARVQLQIGTTECSTQNNNILHTECFKKIDIILPSNSLVSSF